jgi:hypothetical protein
MRYDDFWIIKSAFKGKNEIRLESALSKGRGIESALKGKGDSVCKEKDYFCEKLRDFFEVVKLYQTTCLLVKFNDFWIGQIIMGDPLWWRIQSFFKVISL